MQNHQRVSVINSKLEGHSWSLWPPSACVWHPGPWGSVPSSLPFTPDGSFHGGVEEFLCGGCQSLLSSELLGVPSPTSLSPHPPLSQHNWTIFQGRPKVGCSGRPGTQVREGVLKGFSVGGRGASSLDGAWSGAVLSKGFKTPWSYFPWEDVWNRIQTSTRKLLSCGGLLYGGWTGRRGL